MKKIIIISALCLLVSHIGISQELLKKDRIKTEWGEKIDVNNVLPEYPRPLLEREQWLNLNGYWEYAIRPKGEIEPEVFDGRILVPFAVESALSEVSKIVGEKNELWYKRNVSIPSAWKKKDLLLNFGAVDWKADVYINDILVASHKGGYTPFSINITPFLSSNKQQKIAVCVWDPTDKGFQPRGKQVVNPKGIFYTSVTGIWQTVWLEPVSKNYITNIKSISDIDNNTLSVTASSVKFNYDIVKVELLDNGKVIAMGQALKDKEVRLTLENPILWEPSNPYLYDLRLSLISDGKVVDQVKSYSAFRKISHKRDERGIMRMQLNNKDLLHFGLLDQGWWPDGLYTAPSDEALLFDILKTKEWGFNMIRKHVKVEPARWYYHCDREGVLVWQDMPSGESKSVWQQRVYNGGIDSPRSQESKDNFHAEWKDVMDLCMSNPSVVMWVPFNEAWGQFETEKVAEMTKTYDPSRLVSPASGGNHRACGDIFDIHSYPAPKMFLYDPMRVNVLGEYGGIGLVVKDHIWDTEKRNWGYIQFKSKDEVTNEYIKYARQLKDLVKAGFSAGVYTQTTDVEGEVNGLITYDRKVVKIDEEKVREVNLEVINELK